MAINVNDVYEDTLDKINDVSNGQLSYARFNRLSWLAQLRLIDWLSGDVSDIIPPQPYASQKNRDWLSPFITKSKKQVENGLVLKPDDYYSFENGYLLGNYNEGLNEDGEEVISTNCNIPIGLLSGDEFYLRCTTFIEGLEPSFKKPITKEIGNTFEFLPQDLGSITIEYIRLPVKARIGTSIDTQYNEEVYDPATSVDFEWSPFAQDILSWFIADAYFNYVSNQSGKAFNIQTGKTVRDAK